jgi:uncharacterized membrane protein
MHAAWNAMAHAAADRLVGFALISVSAGVFGIIVVATHGALPARDLAFAAVSAALHISYMMLLWRGYQRGDLSRVYPLSRGTGVAVVALISIAVPRSPLGLDVVVGALLVIAGLVGITLAGPGIGRTDSPEIVIALATGAAIGLYTVVDGLAVSGGAPVLAYAGWLFLLQSWAMPVLAVARRGRRLPSTVRRQAVSGLGGGLVSVAAYGLVLLAQTSGALAAVAALREVGIAVGVLLGATVLHERSARARVAPALVLTAGAVVLALGM